MRPLSLTLALSPYKTPFRQLVEEMVDADVKLFAEGKQQNA